ncbi:MAG: hypothetical protein Q7K42_01430, partial [Candidatus Diapherotrites archaeon]|nr:hypothetical protein [Candidatus Diapherotrites archaeon]
MKLYQVLICAFFLTLLFLPTSAQTTNFCGDGILGEGENCKIDSFIANPPKCVTFDQTKELDYATPEL